jgi:hypothetical protein
MIQYLQNTTLHERQSRYYNGYQCPYCNNLNDYVDSSVVHQESHGMIYYCKPCQAWVGTHGTSDQSLGFVAKLALRKLRIEAAEIARPLIKKKMDQGLVATKAQAAFRNWIAAVLGIDSVECHVAMMDNDRCNLYISECKKWYKTPEQIEAAKKEIVVRKQAIYFLADALDFEIKEWELMGKTHLSFIQGEKRFEYILEKNEGYWSTDKKQKYKPVESIEKFLDSNFNSMAEFESYLLKNYINEPNTGFWLKKTRKLSTGSEPESRQQIYLKFLNNKS